jgi:hypothetical protein
MLTRIDEGPVLLLFEPIAHRAPNELDRNVLVEMTPKSNSPAKAGTRRVNFPSDLGTDEVVVHVDMDDSTVVVESEFECLPHCFRSQANPLHYHLFPNAA